MKITKMKRLIKKLINKKIIDFLKRKLNILVMKNDPISNIIPSSKNKLTQTLTELPKDFDEEAYLDLNPDVKKAGLEAKKHYLEFGIKENRSWNKNRITKRPQFASHDNIWNWLRINASKPNLKVLEIGSRSVVSDAVWKNFISEADYTGFDVSHGKNVDVVGDIHSLSNYFPDNHFDFIISFAVFEHLAMPWIATEEISKVLKPGGHVVIETHFSYSEHELPWHYFQFNSNALEVLFL